MSDDKGRYLRVYYDRFCREHPEVVDDDAAFAGWMRLFIAAERAWPDYAELPRNVKRQALDMLISRELVELLPRHRFRFRGLDKERTNRSAQASRAATARWTADSNAPSNADSNAHAFGARMPRKDETRREEKVDARDDLPGYDGRADLEAWLDVKRRPPTKRQRDVLDDYVVKFDQTGPERAARLIYENRYDPLQALLDDMTAYFAQRAIEAKQAEEEAAVRRADLRAPVKFVSAPADMSPEEAKRQAAEYHEESKRRMAAEGAA